MALADGLRGRKSAITIKELSAITNVSTKKLYRDAKLGVLRVYRFGYSIRIDPTDATRYLEEHR